MPKVLTSQEIEHFKAEGFVCPVSIMAPQDARAVLDAVALWEDRSGKRAKTHLRGKPHLLLKAIANLIRHPRLLDAAEDLIGPDILCLETGFLWKDAHDPPLAINTWIALTQLLSISRDLANIVVVADYLNRRNVNP